jgi:hypothetical protein
MNGMAQDPLQDLFLNFVLFGSSLIWSMRFRKHEMFLSENVFGVFGMYQLVLFTTRLWTMIHGKI